MQLRSDLNITVLSNTKIDDRIVTFHKKNHLLLSESINLMSEVFGVQILFITMLIITVIVEGFSTAINYAKATKGNETIRNELILVSVWNTSIFIVS